MNAAVGWQPIASYLPLQEICPAFNFSLFYQGFTLSFTPLTAPQPPSPFRVHLLFSTRSFPTWSLTMLLTSPGWSVFKAYLLPSILSPFVAATSSLAHPGPWGKKLIAKSKKIYCEQGKMSSNTTSNIRAFFSATYSKKILENAPGQGFPNSM